MISKLYNLLEALENEQHSIFHEYTIYKLKAEERNYFLLPLVHLTTRVIMEDYLLEESHFSIDQVYYSNAAEHGLTPIHYTETYFSNSKKKHIVIHGYLDEKSCYIYSQAKQVDKQNIMTDVIFKLDVHQENVFKKNFQESNLVLNDLLVIKNTRWQLAKKEADQLEMQLTALSRAFDPKTTMSSYITKAYAFVQAVQKLNQYSEEQDARDKLMLNMLQNIEKIRSYDQAHSEIAMPSTIVQGSECKNELLSNSNPSTDSLKSLYKKNMKDFEKSIKKVKTLNLSDTLQLNNTDILVTLNQWVAKLTEQAFLLYSFPKKCLIKKDEMKIKNVFLEIDRYYKQYGMAFNQKALAGDLDSVKAWFPLLSETITPMFYSSLIESLVYKEKNKIQDKILDICCYLKEKDPQYTRCISDIAQKARYSFLEKTENILNQEIPQSCEVSLLFKLYSDNKLSIFKTLIQHGISPNTWGVTGSGDKQKFFSLFYCIAVYGGKTNYLEYLQILLEYKTNPNLIYTTEEMTALRSKKLHNTKKILQCKARYPSFLANANTFNMEALSWESSLLIISRRAGLEGVNILLNSASPQNLAIAIAVLSENNKARKVSMLASDYDIIDANNQEQAYQKISRILEKKEENLITYVLYPNPSNTPKDNICILEVFQKIQLMLAMLKKKISEMNNAEFHQHYEALFRIGEEEGYRDKIEESFYAFLGCESLLMTRCFHSDCNLKEKQSLIEQYREVLYKNIICGLNNILVPEQAKNRIALYCKVLSFDFYKSSETKTTASSGNSCYYQETVETNKMVEQQTTDDANISALCRAAQSADTQKLTSLLLHLSDKVNMSASKTQGCTALHYACAKAQVPCARVLIISGADVTIRNKKGKTPLDLMKNPAEAKALEEMYFTLTASKNKTSNDNQVARMHPS